MMMQVKLSDSVRNEVRKITENKAFYAAAGAGDLAVEKLRTLPDLVARLQRDVPKQITRARQDLPGEFSRVQDTVRYRLGEQGQNDLASLSGRAVEYVTVASARAVQTYDELAERGKTVAGRAARIDPQEVANQTAAELESAARSALRRANRTVDAARETALSRAPMIARTRTANGTAGSVKSGAKTTGTDGTSPATSGSAPVRASRSSSASKVGKASSGSSAKASAAKRSGNAARSSPASARRNSTGGSTAKRTPGSK
jgi:hypothetical protein